MHGLLTEQLEDSLIGSRDYHVGSYLQLALVERNWDAVYPRDISFIAQGQHSIPAVTWSPRE
jgi:hypothetical protein